MAGIKSNSKEIEDIVRKAYDLRYNENYNQQRYVKWAKKEYGKSEQQCCQYFLKAKHYHTTMWKDLLERQLTPAVEELIRLMADENPKIRDAAIAKIFRYSGNEVQKIHAEIKGDIEVSFNAPD
tara:strand:- start:276 stop:647 length:372 start_codon:yes stop_codon:yes gene_type:complete